MVFMSTRQFFHSPSTYRLLGRETFFNDGLTVIIFAVSALGKDCGLSFSSAIEDTGWLFILAIFEMTSYISNNFSGNSRKKGCALFSCEMATVMAFIYHSKLMARMMRGTAALTGWQANQVATQRIQAIGGESRLNW